MPVGRFKFVIWTRWAKDPFRPTVEHAFAHLRTMCTKYEWSYYHASLESCPDTGRPHIDGYYEYPAIRTWRCENKKFLKFFDKGYGDLASARGTAGENEDYSEKEIVENKFERFGEPSRGQGFRTDLATISKDIMAGNTIPEYYAVHEPQIYHQYGRTLTTIHDCYMRSKYRTEMTKGTWYWGPTGVGKSHRALSNYSPVTHYLWKNDRGWQDGYQGQSTVIINELRPSNALPYDEILNLTDKWPHTLSRRGREPIPFVSKHVIVTSRYPPEEVWPVEAAGGLEEFYRRFEVIEVTQREGV